MIEIVEDRTVMLQHWLPHNAVCAEVGVFNGLFSRMIWEHTAPRRLHLIDIWADIGAEGEWCTSDTKAQGNMMTVSRMFVGPIKAGRVALHQGCSANILALFPRAYFDWVYIDADHSYEGVMLDLEASGPLIKQGGLIVGHDYATPEQAQGIRHYYPGVARAVTEFCSRYGWRIICLSKQGDYSGPDIAGRNAPSYILARQ